MAKKPDGHGLIQEERRLLDESTGGTKYTLQVRYRDPKTRKVVWRRSEAQKRGIEFMVEVPGAQKV